MSEAVFTSDSSYYTLRRSTNWFVSFLSLIISLFLASACFPYLIMTIFGLNIEETFDFLYKTLYQSSLPNHIIFLIFVILAIGIGQIVPSLLKFILYLGDRAQRHQHAWLAWFGEILFLIKSLGQKYCYCSDCLLILTFGRFLFLAIALLESWTQSK